MSSQIPWLPGLFAVNGMTDITTKTTSQVQSPAETKKPIQIQFYFNSTIGIQQKSKLFGAFLT